jgi:DNA-binding NtrC family response regulator
MAEGGTLVLDEVTELPTSLQLEVLQLLQDRVFEPRGSRRKALADVRIVATTRHRLLDLVRSGSFRQDLFYQLNVVNMQLPSLQERREDIPKLVTFFLDRLRYRTGKALRGVTEEVMSLLLVHDYPGNIRELGNAIEHAFVLCQGEWIEVRHLPASIREGKGQFLVKSNMGITNPRQAAEAEVIRQALDRHRGNRLAAARELDMHRTTLWRKLKQYGIEDKDER